MATMADLVTDARLLSEIVRELDVDARAAIDDLDCALACLVVLDEALWDLAGAKRTLENRVGAAMAARQHVVMGVGTFLRSAYRPGRHRCIDEEALWRTVLDTRVVTGDGEILPTLEVVVRAYGSESRATGRIRLTGASPTKIEALGIDAEQFFEATPRLGWKVQVLR
jgi:hypothetical protein